jgi:Replication-relaxation
MRTVYSAAAGFYLGCMHLHSSRKTKRRSHLVRRTIERCVKVTEADVRDIFEPLARHAQLTTRQLVAFGTRHPITTKARLGELWHMTERQPSHWLHRLNEELPLANHLFVEDMHRLGDQGLALLQSSSIISAEDWVLNSRIGGRSLAPSRVIRLAHDHMASDIMIDIEVGARKAGLAFRNHIHLVTGAPRETRALKKPLKIPVTVQGKDTFVEPDAFFSIAGRWYALEADKGTESIASVIVPKILAYREIVADHIIDDWLAIDNLRVLFATTSVRRMQHVMRELQRITTSGRSNMFAFRAEVGFGAFLKNPTPDGRLVHALWSRVGCDDLILAKAVTDARPRA